MQKIIRSNERKSFGRIAINANEKIIAEILKRYNKRLKEKGKTIEF